MTCVRWIKLSESHCCCSVTKRCLSLVTSSACQASLPFTTFRSLLKLMSTVSMMPSNHLILCCSLLLLPSIFPSIRIFPNESALHIRWPKYRSFSFSIRPSSEFSGLISFQIDSVISLISLQSKGLSRVFPAPRFKSINSLCSTFFTVQLSHPYMTTGKITADEGERRE